jgi:hypothetical protein
VRAQAEVRAVTEHQVRVRVAADVESARICEYFGVTVGRGKGDDHLVPGPDGLAADVGVGRGRPAEGHDRRPPAEHLLDRGRHQGRIGAQLFLRLWILDQRDARAGQAIAQRLVPGHSEQPEHVLELGHRHLAAVLVRLGQQDRHHVVAGAAPLFLRQQVSVGVQVGHALAGPRVGHAAVPVRGGPRRERLGRHRRAPRRVELGRGGVVGVLVADHPVGPVEQQPAVLFRNAEHVGQGEQRQVSGHVLGEVGLAFWPVEGPVTDGPRVPADAVLQLRDRPRRERPAQQPPQPGVLRRVHVEHHLPHVAQRLRRGRVADLRRAEPGREELRPGKHGLDVGVPEHEPETGPLGPAQHGDLGHPRDRGGVPKACKGIEGHPAGVGGRVEDDLGVRPCTLGQRH